MGNRAKFIVAMAIIGGLCCLPLLAGDREGEPRKGGEVKRDGGDVRKGDVRKEGDRKEAEVRKGDGGNLAAAQEGALRGEVAQLKVRVNQLEGEVRQIKLMLARQGVKLNAEGDGGGPAAGDGDGPRARGDGDREGGRKEHADKGGDHPDNGHKEGEGQRKGGDNVEGGFRAPPL